MERIKWFNRLFNYSIFTFSSHPLLSEDVLRDIQGVCDLCVVQKDLFDLEVVNMLEEPSLVPPDLHKVRTLPIEFSELS